MTEYPVIKQGDTDLAWVELRITNGLCNTVEDIDRNIEYALRRKYISLQDILGTESGAVSVVGSGPSLKDNWHKLRDVDADIMVCNGACKFLLEKGIVPKYMFCFDADELAAEFIVPHPDITYLIASRCPPKAFDMLDGCRVVCWHAAGDKNLESLLEKHNKMEPMVIGGTAAITRSIALVPPMGYRTIHLWGCDSSFLNGSTHVKEQTAPEQTIDIMCNNKAFKCAPWMAQQAEDFKLLAPPLTERGIKIIVHGTGLIPHLAKTMNYDVDDEPRAKQVLRDVTQKARTLWSQL